MAAAMTNRNRIYGSTTVSDEATAFLGDRYTSYQIQHATFVFGDASKSLPYLEAGGIKRKHALTVDNAVDIVQDPTNDQRHADAARDSRKRLQTEQPDSSRCPKRVRLLGSGYNISCRFLDGIVSSMPISASKAAQVANSDGRARPDTRRLKQTVDPWRTPHTRDTDAPGPLIGGRNLLGLAIPAVALSSVLCRNISLNLLLGLIRGMKNDPLLPVVAAVLGYWGASYFQQVSVPQNPSELNGDCIILEDVYQAQRKVPLAYFANPEILQAFLKTHYKGSTAEGFIADGQFNMSVLRSYEDPWSISELCSSRLKPGSLVFMAVLYRVSDLKCLECLNKLKRSQFDTYECTYCRRVYNARFSKVVSLSHFNTASFLLPFARTPDVVAMKTGLGGFLNVDLGLRSPSAQHRNQDKGAGRGRQTENTHRRRRPWSRRMKPVGRSPNGFEKSSKNEVVLRNVNAESHNGSARRSLEQRTEDSHTPNPGDVASNAISTDRTISQRACTTLMPTNVPNYIMQPNAESSPPGDPEFITSIDDFDFAKFLDFDPDLKLDFPIGADTGQNPTYEPFNAQTLNMQAMFPMAEAAQHPLPGLSTTRIYEVSSAYLHASNHATENGWHALPRGCMSVEMHHTYGVPGNRDQASPHDEYLGPPMCEADFAPGVWMWAKSYVGR